VKDPAARVQLRKIAAAWRALAQHADRAPDHQPAFIPAEDPFIPNDPDDQS